VTRGRKAPAIERTLARCQVVGECWIFTGAKNAGGYGVVGIATGRNATTHRVTYEHFMGDVPAGLDLDHLCRNRACCNPWHLEPVTRAVNANRGLRAKGYRDPHCRRGHEFTPDNTGQDSKGRVCLTCQRAINDRKNAKRRAVRAA
jgi:hypothetical protein